jgi:hypothetical protein
MDGGVIVGLGDFLEKLKFGAGFGDNNEGADDVSL